MALPSLQIPNFFAMNIMDLCQAGLTLALLGAIESLLSALVVDEMTSTKHDSDREILGQGIANTVAACFGFLIGTGAIARSVVNVNAGGRGRMSGIIHALVLILLIAAYTYWNFSYFRFRDPWQQGRVCVRQNVAMFLLHFVAYAVLFLKSEDERVILFYLAQVVFLAVYLGLYKVFYPLRSRLLVNNMCMLLCIGFVILTRLDFDKALRQFVIVAVSALITWIIPFILERVWQLANIPWVYGFAGLALLIVVWIIGNNSFGAQLSVNIAGIAFQPSEFVKILFVFFTACMFYRDTEFKTIIETTVMAAAYVLVLVCLRT